MILHKNTLISVRLRKKNGSTCIYIVKLIVLLFCELRIRLFKSIVPRSSITKQLIFGLIDQGLYLDAESLTECPIGEKDERHNGWGRYGQNETSQGIR